MLFERSQAELAVMDAIERGSRRLTTSMLQDLLTVAIRSYRPPRYDEHQRGVRLRYEGRAEWIYRAARAQRYPTTFARMPDVPFNWTAHLASVEAAVYGYEPDRYLVGSDKKRLKDEDDAAVAFAELVRQARLALLMPELERRARATGTVFARVGWFPDFDAAGASAGRPCVHLFWPGDVFVVPHHSRPTELSTAVAIIARSAGPIADRGLDPSAPPAIVEVGGMPMGHDTWFEVWTRPVEENADRSIKSLGPWSVEKSNLAGESYLPFGSTDATWPIPRAPWCVFHVGIPDGSPFVDQDRDLVAVTDTLNVNWSNVVYVADMQGHDQTVVTGHSIEAEAIAVGPDIPLKLGPGQTANLLSPNPKLADMLAINNATMRTLAMTRRQSPDAYATEPGPPLTGVSRRIANEPQDKARREAAHATTDFEEQQLLPVLLAVAMQWGGFKLPPGVTARMTPKDPPDFEDPSSLQTRTIEATDKGWIDDARGSVEAGYYPNEDDAREALKKIEAEAPKPSNLPIAPSKIRELAQMQLDSGQGLPPTTTSTPPPGAAPPATPVPPKG